MAIVLSQDQFNRIMAVVRHVEQAPRNETTPEPQLVFRPSAVVDQFFGRIVTTGPAGEADLDGARYWVERLQLDAEAMGAVGNTPAPADAVLKFEPVNPPQIVAGHVLEEYGVGSGEEGLHAITRNVGGLLAPVRYVMVAGISTTAGVRYFIKTYPGQMFEGQYAYLGITDCTDSCPNGFYTRTTGPSVLQVESPAGC